MFQKYTENYNGYWIASATLRTPRQTRAALIPNYETGRELSPI